jgi:hypothetical protein
MSTNEENIMVRHEKPAQRFAVRLDGKIGYLSYEQKAEKLLDYAHTYVPPEFRNRGIAAKLTQHALMWARENGYSIIPSCSYVQAYINRHPEFHDLVAEP